ncbi:MAG: hypothetical protein V1872_02100 [bacterium]
MFVDFSGDKPHYVDHLTGEVIEVELSVAVLGASSYIPALRRLIIDLQQPWLLKKPQHVLANLWECENFEVTVK